MGSILVIGATGTVGSEVVRRLAARGASVRAATRRPAEAPALPPGVQAVEFDLARPETHASALAGADRAFLIARPGDDAPERAAVPLLDEMKRRGVRHVVDLSALGVEKLESAGLRRVERHLETSGMGFTHLRPNFFFQIFSTGSIHAGIRAAGVIRLPAADARISFVDARDVGAVAAEALLDDRHAGQAYTLTGPDALDHADIARALAAASGRDVRYEAIDEDTARRLVTAAGLPPARVDRLLGFYRLVRTGLSSPVSLDVARVLGRPPTPVSTFARDFATVWNEGPPPPSPSSDSRPAA